jgi:hypothetical protein
LHFLFDHPRKFNLWLIDEGIQMQLLKCILIGLFVMSLGACGVSKGNIPVRSPSTLVSHMGASTVGLVMRNDEGKARVYCTGVWVSKDTVLTADHCVEAAARMHKAAAARAAAKASGKIVIEDDEDMPIDPVGTPINYIVESEVTGVGEEPSAVHLGSVVASDSDHDLALVRMLPGGLPGHDVAELTGEMPALGEHVFIVGHVKGFWWSYIEGVVSAYRKDLPFIDKVGPFVQVSGPVYYGNSGGGAFDSDGYLVGICSFMARAPQTNFFIHGDSIKRFLSNNL